MSVAIVVCVDEALIDGEVKVGASRLFPQDERWRGKAKNK
jgi:hypothetical protein